MRRVLVSTGLIAALLAGVMSARPCSAQTLTPTLDEAPLPGGVRAAAAAIQDAGAVDRAHFLLDFIRRAYNSPTPRVRPQADPLVNTLIAHLDGALEAERGLLAGAPANGSNGGGDAAIDTVPLPLSRRTWIETIFGGRVTPETLVANILRSRDTALLYFALFSLDDETAAWLEQEPALLRDIVNRYVPRFTIVAPALRIRNGRVHPPGGDPAGAAWEALVGASTTDAPAFVRSLLASGNGRICYLYGTLGQLPDARVQFALEVNASDGPAPHVDSARRLFRVFDGLSAFWDLDAAAFWRPTVDPAVLLAELPLDNAGRPILPGTLAFWRKVFDNADVERTPLSADELDRLVRSAPADFPSLCEQMFGGGRSSYETAHYQVLFASHILDRLTIENARDALDAVRAFVRYPALVGTLDRAGVRDVTSIARAARKAAELSRIGDRAQAVRSLSQFQAALFVVTRAAFRGSVSREQMNRALASLVDLPLSREGAYDGQLARWLADLCISSGVLARPVPAGLSDPFDELAIAETARLDRDVLRLLAGSGGATPAVEWEGTRYRVDLAWAEGIRLVRLIGDHPRPYLATAAELVDIADPLSAPAPAPELIGREAMRVQALGRDTAWEPAVASSFDRLARVIRDRDLARVTAALRWLADDLIARGLTDYAYAAALGRPDAVMISAGEAASRHDFSFHVPFTRSTEWQLPVARADTGRDWHATGSLLGLDLGLAKFSLASISSKPPSRAPTMSSVEQAAFTSAVALVQPAAVTDAAMGAIATALRAGRARVASMPAHGDAGTIADRLHLDAARRSLLRWTLEREPDQLLSFFSVSELLQLGLSDNDEPIELDAWGAPAMARTGCLCLSASRPNPWGVFSGRWQAAFVASGFPDLTLRVGELLADLGMPAALVGPVLAGATLDFVSTANPRDHEDRRSLDAFVGAMRVDQVEEYLALLTTDGPLVPIDETPPTGQE